ncbi:hypothetical protein GCM10028798_35570 [Humibacter antri]
MDRFGIERAIVGSTAAQHDPALSNRELVRQIDGNPRLRARWELLPVATGEFDLEATMLAAEQHDVAAFELHPCRHGYPLGNEAVHDAMQAVAELRRPVWFEHEQLSWQSADALAQEHPSLDIVISALGYRELRPLVSLMDKHTNVYVDTVNFSSHQGLEWLAARTGDRLIFATGCPHNDLAESVTRLLLSGLDENGLLAAGTGTIARLTGWSRKGQP